jgi:hypothetical protein
VGIPCRHAVAAITRTCENPQNYVHKYYHKQTYIDCYNESISPIDSQRRWPKTEFPDILPPNYKRGPGRPKKLREPDEGNQHHWKRHGTKGRCGFCTIPGHNKRSCPQLKNVSTTNEKVATNDGGSQLHTQGSQTGCAAHKEVSV